MSTGRRRGRKHQRSQQQNLDNVPPHKRLKLTLPDLDKPSHVHHRQDVIGESESDDDDNDNDMYSPNDEDDTQSDADSNDDHDKENNDMNTNDNSSRYQYQQPPQYNPQLSKQQKIASSQFKVVLKSKQARTQRELVKAKVSFATYSDSECVKQAFLKLIKAVNMPQDLELYNLKFDNWPTAKSLPDLVLDWNLDQPDIEWDKPWLTFYLTQIHSAKKSKKIHCAKRNAQTITDKEDLNEAFKEADAAMEPAFGSHVKNVDPTLKAEWECIKANHVVHSKTLLRKATTNDTVVDVLQYGQELMSKFKMKKAQQSKEQETQSPMTQQLQSGQKRMLDKLENIEHRVRASETQSQPATTNSIDPLSLIVGLHLN